MAASSSQLRTLFAQLLIFCPVANPVSLWERYWTVMQDDIPAQISKTTGISDFHVNTADMKNHILYELELILNEYGKSITEFGLPPLSRRLREELKNRLLMEERNYDTNLLQQQTLISVQRLNQQQRVIYETIVGACRSNKQKLLFVYGHGGTGKTFLWKTVIDSVRSEGKIVLAVASSGIASLLLPAGRTAHSRFKIPLDLTDDSLCHARKHSQLANLLLETQLIVWDEAPMNDKRCFEALDRTLRDLMETPDTLFGGKSVILGGDFRQTLPVKKGATKAELIQASVAKSFLWLHFTLYALTENMRLSRPTLTLEERQKCQAFADWLLHIGNGTIGTSDTVEQDDVHTVVIPDQYCIPADQDGLSNLIDFIYDKATLDSPNASSYQQKAIVCPKNSTADVVNNAILKDVSGEMRT